MAGRENRAHRGTADGFGVRVKVQLDGHQKDVPALSLRRWDRASVQARKLLMQIPSGHE